MNWKKLFIALFSASVILTGCNHTTTPKSVEVVAINKSNTNVAAPKQLTSKNFKLDSKYAKHAYWSTYSDGVGVLQIDIASLRDNQRTPKTPNINAWLIKADGTTSSKVSSDTEESMMGISMMGITNYKALFNFKPEDTSSAIGLLIQVEKKFFLFQLKEYAK